MRKNTPSGKKVRITSVRDLKVPLSILDSDLYFDTRSDLNYEDKLRELDLVNILPSINFKRSFNESMD
jgi:hypothetical protein